MRIPALLAGLAATAFLVLITACGDGAGTGTATTPVTVAPSGTAAVFGPPPTLGKNVLKISPGHGVRITQAKTRSPDATNPKGVCADVSFEGLPENGRWFRMAIDGQEVTQKLTWIVKSTSNPTGGQACYAPAAGLTIGVHQLALTVQNPTNPNEPTREAVAWAFEVTP